MFMRRLFCKICRSPTVNDKVKLSRQVQAVELRGLQRGDIATIIAHDKADQNLCYQVRLDCQDSTPWFAANELELLDANSEIPKPIEPDTSDCCGSQCENCVWIKYFRDLKTYESNNIATKVT